jgi:hypothetical protein
MFCDDMKNVIVIQVVSAYRDQIIPGVESYRYRVLCCHSNSVVTFLQRSGRGQCNGISEAWPLYFYIHRRHGNRVPSRCEPQAEWHPFLPKVFNPTGLLRELCSPSRTPLANDKSCIRRQKSGHARSNCDRRTYEWFFNVPMSDQCASAPTGTRTPPTRQVLGAASCGGVRC